jgi:DNA-binding SARP family transcriptional activator
MAGRRRIVAVVGRLGVFPATKLSAPARRILAYLAIRGPSISRSVAAAELWPDVCDDTARANLRRALWNSPLNWIMTEGEDLTLDADTDFANAEAAAAAALSGAPLGYEDIRLLSDDLLPGWHEEWLMPLCSRFHELRVQALEAACRTMTASGHLALATQAGSAALTAEPLRESAAEALIDAHFAQCNRYEAMRCYRTLAERLNEELGVTPNAKLAARFAENIAA